MAFEFENIGKKSALAELDKITKNEPSSIEKVVIGDDKNKDQDETFKMSENARQIILTNLEKKIARLKSVDNSPESKQDSEEYIQALNNLKLKISIANTDNQMDQSSVEDIRVALGQLKSKRAEFLQNKKPLMSVGVEVKKASSLLKESKNVIHNVQEGGDFSKEKKRLQLVETKNRLLSEVSQYEAYLDSFKKRLSSTKEENELLKTKIEELEFLIEQINSNIEKTNLLLERYKDIALESERSLGINNVRDGLINNNSNLISSYFALKSKIEKGKISTPEELEEDNHYLLFDNTIMSLSKLQQQSHQLQYIQAEDNNPTKGKNNNSKKEFDNNKSKLSADIQKVLTEAYNKKQDLKNSLEKNSLEKKVSEYQESINSVSLVIDKIKEEVKKAKIVDEKYPKILKDLDPLTLASFVSKYRLLDNKLDNILQSMDKVKEKDSESIQTLKQSIQIYKDLITESIKKLNLKEPSLDTAKALLEKQESDILKLPESITTLKADIKKVWKDPKDEEGKSELVKLPKDIALETERKIDFAILNLNKSLQSLKKLDRDINNLDLDDVDKNKYKSILEQINLNIQKLQDYVKDLEKEKTKIHKPNLEANKKKIDTGLDKILSDVQKAEGHMSEMKEFLFKTVEPKSQSGWFKKRLEEVFVSPHTWKDAEKFSQVYKVRNETMSKVLTDLEEQIKNTFEFADQITESNLDEKENKKMMKYFADLKKKIRKIKISIYKHNTDKFISTTRGLIKNPKLAVNMIWNNVSERIDNTTIAFNESFNGINDAQSQQAKSELWQGAGKKAIYAGGFVFGGIGGLVVSRLGIMGSEYLYNKSQSRKNGDAARNAASQAGASAMS